MQEWVVYTIGALTLIAVLFGIVRYQSRQYQVYLSRHTETSEGILAEQRRTQAAIDRQTLALERIALALEQRRP